MDNVLRQVFQKMNQRIVQESNADLRPPQNKQQAGSKREQIPSCGSRKDAPAWRSKESHVGGRMSALLSSGWKGLQPSPDSTWAHRRRGDEKKSDGSAIIKELEGSEDFCIGSDLGSPRLQDTPRFVHIVHEWGCQKRIFLELPRRDMLSSI